MRTGSLYNRLLILVILLVCGVKSHAQYAEYEYKAAFIFNFAKFIEWPETDYQTSDTIVLGVYGSDPFGIILEKTMVGRQANGKSWKIIRSNKIENLGQCHIVFMSDINKSEALRVIERYSDQAVLFIGDEMQGFCEMGGNINFTPQYSEHSFEINNYISRQKRIKIDPKLLLLAKIISGNEGEF